MPAWPKYMIVVKSRIATYVWHHIDIGGNMPTDPYELGVNGIASVKTP